MYRLAVVLIPSRSLSLTDRTRFASGIIVRYVEGCQHSSALTVRLIPAPSAAREISFPHIVTYYLAFHVVTCPNTHTNPHTMANIDASRIVEWSGWMTIDTTHIILFVNTPGHFLEQFQGCP
jgi:hypothetical protein